MMSRGRPVFSEAQGKTFCAAADPHQWMLSAADLHEQAVALQGRRGISQVTLRVPGRPAISWDGTNRATFLLAAFALESAIKAFLVYEHPEWIAGGRLADEICSHRLTKLADRSSLIPYRDRDQWVLAGFEDGNESWMRYPCGRHAEDITPQRPMHDKLWNGYRRVMRGYGKKLARLLDEGWTDPYGQTGQWTLGWDYLD
jgi:hypothetical protein